MDLDKNALKSDPKNLSVNTLFEFVMKRHLKKDFLRNNFKVELKCSLKNEFNFEFR